jgi:hypothetical protein
MTGHPPYLYCCDEAKFLLRPYIQI